MVPPLVGVAVKVTLVPEQIGPEGIGAMETLAATDGFTVTLKATDAVLFPHELNGVTEIVPDTALPEKLTVIEFVFDPEAMVAPAGSDQLYPVAPLTEGML